MTMEFWMTDLTFSYRLLGVRPCGPANLAWGSQSCLYEIVYLLTYVMSFVITVYKLRWFLDSLNISAREESHRESKSKVVVDLIHEHNTSWDKLD